MPLTGIQIFKLLPKTNCKECGEPTCLAFAMKLAAGKAELTLCPYISEEAAAQLAEAAAPPIRPVTIGVGDRALKVGGETVMFRHEKRFENPPAFAILVSDTMDDAEIEKDFVLVDIYTADKRDVVFKDFKGTPKEFASLVGAFAYPATLFMNKNGKVINAQVGYRSVDDYNALLQYISTENYKKMDLESFKMKLEIESDD